MDTKRFSQEDLASGMPKSGLDNNESEKAEQKQVGKEDKQNPNTNSNKHYKTAAGITAGVAAVGVAVGATVAGGDNLNFEIPKENEELSAEKHVDSPTPKHVSKDTHQDSHENPIDRTDDTIRVDLKPEEDKMADVEIKSLGEGKGYEMKVDLDGDNKPDILVSPNEDGTLHAQVLNMDNVNIEDESVAVIPLDDSEKPLFAEDSEMITSNDPDELLAEEPAITSDVDANGDTLAEEFGDECSCTDDFLSCSDDIDETDTELDIEDVDMI